MSQTQRHNDLNNKESEISIINKHKQKAKVSHRVLKQNNSPNKSKQSLIRFNTKKLPIDWFTPRKCIENSTSRQTIQTDRYNDTLPTINPQSQYSSQRMIIHNDSQIFDELQRTSHFGQSQEIYESIESPKGSIDKQIETNFLRPDSTVEFEFQHSSSHQQTKPKQQFQIQLKQVILEPKCPEFQLTFSHKTHKGQSFSVKKVNQFQLSKIKQPVDLNRQSEISKIARTPSEHGISFSKSKQLLSRHLLQSRNYSREGKRKLIPVSLQNTQQLTKIVKKKYFQRQQQKNQNQDVFRRIKQLHLPPIMKKNGKN